METCYNCFKDKETLGTCPECGYDPAGDAEEYPMALHLGSILNGRYIVGRVLGQGGFGITYIALDDRTGKRVAIKEYLPTEFAGRSEGSSTVRTYSREGRENFEFGKERFLEEAKTLAEFIGDEHIVRIFSYFEENGTAYFTMEYVEGMSLDKYMATKGGRLSTEEADELLLPLMEALEDVHSKGIVHRDIAPDNIIITKDGKAKLLDFGAARYSTGEKSKSLDVVIKHGFAPYEQYMRRGRQGPFTDVYALAATYYYAITGKVPPDAVERRAEDTLIPPANLGVKISDKTEDALYRALEVSYADRYHSMGEFRRAMEAAGEEERRKREEKEKKEAAERAQREKEAAERAQREKEAAEKARKEQEEAEQRERERIAAEEAERRERERKAEEERRKQKEYEAAVSRMSSAKTQSEWQAVADMLWSISGWKDADVLLEQCSSMAEECRRAETYKKAKAAMETGTVAGYKTALKGFNKIRGYENSDVLADECRKKIAAGNGPKFRKLALVTGSFLVLVLLIVGGVKLYNRISRTSLVSDTALTVETSNNASNKIEQSQTVSNTVSNQVANSTLEQSTNEQYEEEIVPVSSFRPDAEILLTGVNAPERCDVDDWKDIVQVFSAPGFTLGLHSNGTAVATGSNIYGQCEVSNWTDLIYICGNFSHTVGLRSDGTVVATGNSVDSRCDVQNWSGIKAVAAGGWFTIGLKNDGTVISTNTFDLSKWKDITAIAAGNNFAIGLRKDGTVVAVGENNLRQCEVSDWKNIVAIDARGWHAVGLRADGTVAGSGNEGGNRRKTDKWKDIVAISAGYYSTVGQRKDGSLVATGWNYFGEDEIDDWKDIVQFSSGEYCTVGLHSDGTVIAKGRNSNELSPAEEWTNISKISVGYNFIAALRNDGTVITAGANDNFQGDVSSWSGIKDITAGEFHTVGVTADGRVLTQGRNSYMMNKEAANWKDIIAVSAGRDYTVGLRSDGKVVAAGSNERGQCDVGSWKNISAITAGAFHTLGLRTDGTVVATGENGFGQCDVSNWTDIIAIAAGERYSVGLRSDGTVVTAGTDYSGECDVGDWTDIIAIDTGYYHTVGLKSDGTLVATGINFDGQCDLSGWDNITEISAGGFFTAARRSSDTAVQTGNTYSDEFKDVKISATGNTITASMITPGIRDCYTFNLPTTENGSSEYSWQIQFTDGKNTFIIMTMHFKNDSKQKPGTIYDMGDDLWIVDTERSSISTIADAKMTVEGNTLTWNVEMPEEYGFDASKMRILFYHIQDEEANIHVHEKNS